MSSSTTTHHHALFSPLYRSTLLRRRRRHPCYALFDGASPHLALLKTTTQVNDGGLAMQGRTPAVNRAVRGQCSMIDGAHICMHAIAKYVLARYKYTAWSICSVLVCSGTRCAIICCFFLSCRIYHLPLFLSVAYILPVLSERKHRGVSLYLSLSLSIFY